MRHFLSILFILLGISLSYSISIDFRGASLSKIVNIVNFLESKGISIDFVVVDNPFRMTKEGGVYDFDYEDPNFKEIDSFLKQKGINYYIYLCLFTQPKYYSRKLWSINDFKEESISYSSTYIVDYSSSATREKLKKYLSNFKSKGYSLFLDLTFFQDNEADEIIKLFASELDNSMYLLNNKLSRAKGRSVCVSYYWDLRRKFFLYPEANFKGIEDYNLSDEVNFIASDEFSINNIATMSYMIIKKGKILIDHKMLGGAILDLIRFLEQGNFKKVSFSDKRMIYSSGERIVVLNLEGDFSAFDMDFDSARKKGTYFSLTGGGILNVDKRFNFFLFPGSVSCFLVN
ncbi:MAG: hypothetical protein ACP5Q5_03180 [Brevinematia bacterium]